MDDEYSPVHGAKIYLAFDNEGRQLVEGFEAESDYDGRYKIETKNLPPPKNPEGDYYLIVKKEGYMSLVRPIGIGPFSSYLKNTAVLKPLSDE